MKISRPISVIGLGNILMRDEGVGVHVIRAFQERYDTPDGVEIVDGGTAGFDLLPLIEGRDKVLLVDAVNFGREPGAIDVLVNDEIPARFSTKASLHHLGLMDILSITKLAGSAPGELCLVGIQPKALEVGLDMTPEICDKVQTLVERVATRLQDWNVQCVLRSPQKSSR
ncbi:MAG TPA: HyaD/HybD family hydrogenase maturation endopeptidase [Nitrospirota bacterium]